MAFPPSRGLVSPCLSLSPLVSQCLPTIYVCVGWCVRLPKVLSRLVSSIVSHLPSCFPFLDGVPAFSRSCLPGLHVSPIVPHSLPLSPHMCACGGLVSPSLPLSPLSPIVCPHLCLCWMVRLFDVLSSRFVSHCLRTCVPVLDGASALACPPSRGLVSSCLPVLDGVSAFPRSCFPFSPISLLVSLCWMVCPPSRRLVSPCLPLSPHMCACVGRCVPLPKVLSPLVPRCFPTCVPVTFCVGWCVRLPAVLSPS